ncbi:hypothetical protein DIPPA_23469 [Diplonema papillatum]|nr:hypothetical protein DIPPA_23469 [Diplonema papillatum]
MSTEDKVPTPGSKDLNPNAKEFCPTGPRLDKPDAEKPAPRQKDAPKRRPRRGEPGFVMNPEAKPWLPSSFQAPQASKKPVIILFCAPGSGQKKMGEDLAAEFKGRYFSSAVARRKAVQERRQRLDNRPDTVWGEVHDAMAGLNQLLADTVDDESVQVYFLDIHSRNNAIFYYVTWVLRKYGLAPGQVFYMHSTNKSKLVEQLVAEGEDIVQAKKHIEFYYAHEKERLAVFDGVKGLLRRIDATESPEEEIRNYTGILMKTVLSFVLPHAPPLHGVTPMHNFEEYAHVLNVLDAKVSGGDPRWPLAKGTGVLVQNPDGSLCNEKDPDAPLPSSKTHLVSKKTDGHRFALIYTPLHDNANEGRFYLVPKSMDVIYTFRPRIGDADFEEGCAPIYGEAGALMTAVFDGEVVTAKQGWGGLQGVGCQQACFVASDVLYFEGERPRDRIAKNDSWILPKRIEVLHRTRWPDEDSAPSDTKTISLCIKTYYPFHKLPQLATAVATQTDTYTTTGLTFTPVRKYLLHSDPQLIHWTAPAHRHINLHIEKAAEQPQQAVGVQYAISAKKSFHDETLVPVGSAVDIEKHEAGNASCRIIWVEKPEAPFQWVIDGPADNCWEKAGVDTYINKKYWIDGKVIAETMAEAAPVVVEKKARVEKVPSDSEENDSSGKGGRGAGAKGAPRGAKGGK